VAKSAKRGSVCARAGSGLTGAWLGGGRGQAGLPERGGPVPVCVNVGRASGPTDKVMLISECMRAGPSRGVRHRMCTGRVGVDLCQRMRCHGDFVSIRARVKRVR